MKKHLKTLCVLFSLILCLCYTGCAKNNDTESIALNDEPFGSVWSAPSTIKVQQNDIDYGSKGEPCLNFNAVKNEYESCQLFITATRNISEYYLTKTDLKCGDDTISSDNVSIYMEKYVSIDDNWYPVGVYPDALIPIDAAKQYGELKVEKNNNAAIWVTVYVPKTAVVGTYSAVFTLKVDGVTVNVPVSLKVNDYILTDEITANTLFTSRFERTGTGELDGSLEMIRKTYEFYLDYRISCQCLPLESLNGSEVVEPLDEYWDSITTYTILNKNGDISIDILSSPSKFDDQILSIAAASNSERNLFDKAVFYYSDEPSIKSSDVRYSLLNKINNVNAELSKCVNLISADDTGKYDAFKQIAGWEDCIMDIPAVIPLAGGTNYILDNYDTEECRELLEAVNCICPILEHLKDNQINIIKSLCEQYDITLWWYTCSGPLAPSATYHIGDTNLLSARALSWMQKAYDIQGNLYWGAAEYTSENDSIYNQRVDVYSDPYRFSGDVAGDGYLSYPGVDYGIYGPIPSLRLMAIRDGMEEYEMLCDLEAAYEDMTDYYGEGFDVKSCMQYFYDKLTYNSVNFYFDGGNGIRFNDLRDQLISFISNRDLKFALHVGENINNNVDVSFYVDSDCNFYINDVLQGEGEKEYHLQVNLNNDSYLDVRIEKDQRICDYTIYLGKERISLNNVSDEAFINGLLLSEGSVAQSQNDFEYAADGVAAKININGKITGVQVLDATFVPYVSIPLTQFEGIQNISDLSNFCFEIYNFGSDFKFDLRFYSGGIFTKVGTYTINHGKNIVFVHIDDLSFSRIDSVNRIELVFENSSDGVSENSYEFYLDNFYGEIR